MRPADPTRVTGMKILAAAVCILPLAGCALGIGFLSSPKGS